MTGFVSWDIVRCFRRVHLILVSIRFPHLNCSPKSVFSRSQTPAFSRCIGRFGLLELGGVRVPRGQTADPARQCGSLLALALVATGFVMLRRATCMGPEAATFCDRNEQMWTAHLGTESDKGQRSRTAGMTVFP